MKPLTGIYAEELERFVSVNRKMGFSFDEQARIIGRFDIYVAEKGHLGPLTQELALSFATANPGASRGMIADRYQVIRHFSNFLSLTHPDTPQLDPKAVGPKPRRPAAHVLSQENLTRILSAALSICSRDPMRGLTLYTTIGLAASTGMRIGEVCGLDLVDLDSSSKTLLIRKTKFDKDRLVPLHETTMVKLKQYIERRNVALPHCRCPALFLHVTGRRLSEDRLGKWFRTLRSHAGLSEGTEPFTFHSLRHTFAVNRLMAWYREGTDVQVMLPVLATYMGHVHYTDTAWYLSATPELLDLAASRYWDFINQRGSFNEKELSSPSRPNP